MAARQKRLLKEISDCQKEAPKTLINVEAVNDDLSNLRGTFPGPSGSCYEGGLFQVAIEVPSNYPFSPLKMKFITKVYHPNISSASGAICLDILKDAWSPVLTLKTTLVSLQSLLCSPEPTDPQDAEVAKVFLSDPEQFERTARHWTEIYANGPPENFSFSSASTAASPAKHNQFRQGGPSVPPPSQPEGPDPAVLAGLDPRLVAQFVNMGFGRDKVIAVMKRLDYRGLNVAQIGEEAIVEALLS